MNSNLLSEFYINLIKIKNKHILMEGYMESIKPLIGISWSNLIILGLIGFLVIRFIKDILKR